VVPRTPGVPVDGFESVEFEPSVEFDTRETPCTDQSEKPLVVQETDAEDVAVAAV
jgi:hypothetical protein